MKFGKRVLSFILCFVILCSGYSVAAFAATEYVYGDFTYTVSSGKVTITAYPEQATGEVEIPAVIDGKSVVAIDDYAFQACTVITKIIVPDSVESIGKYAFSFCTSLTYVEIPSSVTYIGSNAFKNSNKVVVGCEEGSYAEKYAKENNIKIKSFESDIKDIINKKVNFYIDEYNGTVTINFLNSWFEKNPYSGYNHELAQFCADYAMLGYAYDENTAKSYLKEAGFNDFYSESNNMHTGRDEVNYFLASRDIKVNGKVQKLVFMGTIGSYENQWFSNFDPLGYENANKNKCLADWGKTHRGFADAREFAYGHLSKYINQIVGKGTKKEDIKILLTGHSRGAATANLLAAKLIDSESSFGISKTNIYTYTFATPNVTKNNTNDIKYRSIFNIVNPEDFVTKVMLNKWDFSRYGVTYTLPSKTNIDKKQYNSLLSQVKKEFNAYTGKKFDPYKEGEKCTYKVVSKMAKNVGSVDELYTKGFWYDLDGLIPRYKDAFTFFKKTLLDFLVNKSKSEIIRIAPECGPFYLSILAYFAWPDIDIDSSHLSSIGYLVDGIEDVDIGGKFRQAHQMQTYAAYMNVLSKTQITEYKAGYENTVNCPVDIEVYDSAGVLVGRIVDNVVDEKIENAIVMDVEGESKSFWLPSNEKFTVKLIGNDTGTMDYTVASIDSDIGESERVNFFNVSLTDGLTMTGDFDGNNLMLKDYTLELENGETINPTELSENVSDVEIKTYASGNGVVSESLTVKSGDYITVSATPFDGYKFAGWYNGTTLECTKKVYSFVAKENVSLVARFEKSNDSIFVSIGNDFAIKYRSYTNIKPTIEADSGVTYTVKYESSNPKVATVDENGNVYGAKKGTAEIKVTVTDSNGNTVTDTCKVTVKYTFIQWIIKIVLFGWIWY